MQSCFAYSDKLLPNNFNAIKTLKIINIYSTNVGSL